MSTNQVTTGLNDYVYSEILNPSYHHVSLTLHNYVYSVILNPN